MKRYLIMLEPLESGFGIQVPDLAISSHAPDIEAAKRAAAEAIRLNLEAYLDAGQTVPDPQPVVSHLTNPEFRELLFAYIEVATPDQIAA
ncbi:MAG: type II toxin-antitoxin system HicB family antitoxin [Bryobacteraceae bacterium]